MNESTVRVVLADDHAVMREGLRALLERGDAITVVGEAATGREAVAVVLDLMPDVVIMDFALPDLNGVEACQQIRAQAPTVRVLFLSMHEEEAYFVRALQAGAMGYLVKRSAAADIRAAVLGTARGEVFLAPTLATVLVRQVTGQGPASAEADTSTPLALLTQREREVLHLVASGLTNQAIAHQLGISIKTVQAHREHIMVKLDLRDITQLVRFAIRTGVIRSD
jgi:DNA-binding NarL/FixJ family response regulator